MISTVLASVPWLPLLAVTVFVLAAIPVGVLLVPRRRFGAALAVVALVGVAALTLYPESGRGLAASGCELGFAFDPTGPEPAANVLLFAVPALLAAVRWRHPVLVLGGGIALSALIETIQFALPWLGRSCSTHDWIANGAGAVIGALLGWAALAVTQRRTRTPN